MKKSLLVTSALAFLACGGGKSDPPPVPVAIELVSAFGGEAFNQPLDLVQHPTNDDRWYVVEKAGQIHTLLASNPSGTRALAVDVNAHALISASGDEDGLLNLAFDPDFSTNGLVFLSYIEQSAPAGVDSVVARYRSINGGLTFAPVAGAQTVLRIPRSSASHNAHNGGDLAFGADDYLYVSLGDAVDEMLPQNLSSLFGKILRIDVAATPYANPTDNPFAGSAGLDEIWAYGFRNPWRMSFDGPTGRLWVGDVGQSSWEEIDRVEKGANYGWPCREGDAPFSATASCAPPLEPPQVVHPHPEARSITGGYVYRGNAIAGLSGAYVYGDFISGRIWAFHQFESPRRTEQLADTAHLIAAFGQARSGDLFVVDLLGSIHRIAPDTP